MKKKPKTSGEQMPLMDVGPENNQEIVEAVRTYKAHQHDRIAAGKKEFEAKQKVLTLVKKSELKPLQNGVIKFTCENAEIEVTPRDVLITIKEKAHKKPKKKKNMKGRVETGEEQFDGKK